MDTENLKKSVDEAGFSEEAKSALLEIADKISASGGTLSTEDKNRMLQIIDLEIEKNNLEVDAREEVASALDSFVEEIDSASKSSEEDLDKLEQETEEFKKQQ